MVCLQIPVFPTVQMVVRRSALVQSVQHFTKKVTAGAWLTSRARWTGHRESQKLRVQQEAALPRAATAGVRQRSIAEGAQVQALGRFPNVAIPDDRQRVNSGIIKSTGA